MTIQILHTKNLQQKNHKQAESIYSGSSEMCVFYSPV